MHGYWSSTQWKQNETYYIYTNDKEEEIKVTQVDKEKMEDITKYFKDNEYVGECIKFITSYKTK